MTTVKSQFAIGNKSAKKNETEIHVILRETKVGFTLLAINICLKRNGMTQDTIYDLPTVKKYATRLNAMIHPAYLKECRLLGKVKP